MRTLRIIVLIVIGAFSFNFICPATSSAHSDGHISSAVKEQEAVAIALKHVKLLVKEGKVEKSWENIERGTGQIKRFARSYEWLVTIYNPQVTDPTKGTLYFFLTLKGKYIAANFTGK